MTADPTSVHRLTKRGVPRDFAFAARTQALRLHIPLAVLIAVGEVESHWANVWGHDLGKYREDGLVTQAGVRRYFAAAPARRPNGIGPMQLTSPGLQQAAETRGGLHLVAINVAIGAEYLAGLIRQHGIGEGVRHYNGSGPAAAQYSRTVMGHALTWSGVIHPA